MPALLVVCFTMLASICLLSRQARATRPSASNRKTELMARWALQSTLAARDPPGSTSYTTPLNAAEKDELSSLILESGWTGAAPKKKGCRACATCSGCSAKNKFMPKNTRIEKNVLEQEYVYARPETRMMRVPVKNDQSQSDLIGRYNGPVNTFRKILISCFTLIYLVMV